MKRVIKLLMFVIVLLFLEEHAFAQRGGAGTFSGPNLCSDLVGQLSGQTYCFDWTSGSLNVWNGNTGNWSQLTGNINPITSSASTTSYQLISGIVNVNVLGMGYFQNLNNGNIAQAAYDAINDLGHNLWISNRSSGYAPPGLPAPIWTADSGLIDADGVNGLVILTDAAGAAPIYIAPGGLQVMHFANSETAGIASLDEGFAYERQILNFANPQAGILGSVGGVYQGNTVFSGSQISLSAGAHCGGPTGWYSDAPSSIVSIYNNLDTANPSLNFYYSLGATAPGQPLALSYIGAINGTSWNVSHVDNNQNYGVPTVVNGTAAGGTRDSFGEIISTNAAVPIQIYFAKPFVGNSICTTTDDGQPLLWMPFNKSTTGVSFQCYNLNGTACTGQQWLMYHCFGAG